MSLFTGSIGGEEIRLIIDSLTVIVDECRVKMEQDSIRIRGTDQADTALVAMEIDKEAFDGVEMIECDVCWDFVEMGDMVSSAQKDKEVALTLENHDLHMDIVDLRFTISLIDPESLKHDREKPELDLPGEVVLGSPVLKRGVRAADLIADHVEFGISGETNAFYMEAKGDTNQVILKREKQDLVTVSTDPMSSMYSVQYLKDVCKALPDDVNTTLNFGDDHPLEISFDLLEGQASVTYFIAPRIEPVS